MDLTRSSDCTALPHKLVSIYLGIVVTRSSDCAALSHKFVAMCRGHLDAVKAKRILIRGFRTLVIFYSQEVFWN